MDRDSAVTIVRVLAVLELVGAAFGFLLAALFLIGGPLLASAIAQEDPAFAAIGSAVLGIILTVLGAGFFLLAVLSLLSGIGLWRLRNWGRILSLISSWISIAWCAANLFSLLSAWSAPGAVVGFIGNLVGLAIAIAWVWLLQFQPDVVALFRTPVTGPLRSNAAASRRRSRKR